MTGQATRLAQLALSTLLLGVLLWVPATVDSNTQAAPAFSPVEIAVPQSLLLQYLADNAIFTLVDARSPDEFAGAHIAGAINIPHDASNDRLDRLSANPDDPVVVYCKSGKRAANLRARLLERGYSDVSILRPDQVFWTEGLAVFNCGAPSPAESNTVMTATPGERTKEETQ